MSTSPVPGEHSTEGEGHQEEVGRGTGRGWGGEGEMRGGEGDGQVGSGEEVRLDGVG